MSPKPPPPKASEPRRPSEPDRERFRLDDTNLLSKWAALMTGWQLGTATEYQEAAALADHRKRTLILEATVCALVGLCVRAGAFDHIDFRKAFAEEVEVICKALEKQFPGFKAGEDGMVIDPAIAQETVKNWKP